MVQTNVVYNYRQKAKQRLEIFQVQYEIEYIIYDIKGIERLFIIGENIDFITDERFISSLKYDTLRC